MTEHDPTDAYHVPVDPAAANNPHSIAIRMVGAGRRVLEVGCWSGHATQHLVAAGNVVVGIEVDPKAAARNAHASAVHVVDLDHVAASTIPELANDRFDVILLGDVLEHLRDPVATLADLVGLLADDGRLVVSVPNVAHIDVRLHLLSGRWSYQGSGLLDRTHLRWFTRESLGELLAAVGFSATRVETVRLGLGVTGLDTDYSRLPVDAHRYVDADPDADVFQYVVEAHRGTGAGSLDAPTWTPPDFAAEARAREAEHARLVQECDALRAEVEAWRNSRLVRLSAPARRIYARSRRRRPSG